MSRFVIPFIALWFFVLYYPKQTEAICAAIHAQLSSSIDSVWAAKPYAAKP